MKKLTKKQTDQIFAYLLEANTFLNSIIEASDDGEIGIDGGQMDDIGNLADALKDKIDNAQWL